MSAPRRTDVAPTDVAPVVAAMGRHVLEGAEDPFFLVDLHAVQSRIDLWHAHLPDVEPFYAVKCNPDPTLLSLLASNGVNFDCASRTEMHEVLQLGVDSSRIVYANPCKQPSHARYAAAQGVQLLVFDSESELHKIAACHPRSDLIIRIQVDDSKAQCVMSDKYGAPLADVPRLLRLARELGLSVRGVSFHVGSGCYSVDSFVDAVESAARVHRIAADCGTPMDLVDIGGGFPGVDTAQLSFAAIASALRPVLAQHFPRARGVRVIAEPGRFFAATSHTLAVNVIGKKYVTAPDGSAHAMYYVNDGLYGSLNCVVYDHAHPEFRVLPDVLGGAEDCGTWHSSSIWGPTCDGFDCIVKQAQLPRLEVGRWLYFEDMGAYTSAAGSNFNGMPLPQKYYLPPSEEFVASGAASRVLVDDSPCALAAACA
jgi:ornithine decarboxylase